MADEVPLALKHADVHLAKCASRAAQLQNVKPIITYWCEYWVVNQILAKQLHNIDGEILEYTTKLMDKLERTKNEYASEDAVTDDAAGQAYVEQFAQETLDRAQRVVKANKVTAQTAGTFDAAATFFTLVNIWGAADQETLQKIKYAKWNATRIYKAIKEGKDPNESNPRPEELPAQPPAAFGTGDPDPRLFGAGPKPVTVEEVPDVDMRRDSAGVSLPQSPASSSHPPSAPDDGGLRGPGSGNELPRFADPNSTPPRAPSPMSPPPHNPASYQPPPSAPDWAPTPSPPANQPAFAPPPHPPPPPQAYDRSAPSGSAAGPPTFALSPRPTAVVASPPPLSPGSSPSYMHMAPSASFARPTIPPPSIPHLVPAAVPPVAQRASVVVDDAAKAQAQKHAKWAVSALNYEDVATAIKELRKALETLGAS